MDYAIHFEYARRAKGRRKLLNGRRIGVANVAGEQAGGDKGCPIIHLHRSALLARRTRPNGIEHKVQFSAAGDRNTDIGGRSAGEEGSGVDHVTTHFPGDGVAGAYIKALRQEGLDDVRILAAAGPGCNRHALRRLASPAGKRSPATSLQWQPTTFAN